MADSKEVICPKCGRKLLVRAEEIKVMCDCGWVIAVIQKLESAELER